jgi:hypothetical protein
MILQSMKRGCKLQVEDMVALLHCGEDGCPDDVIG